VAVDGFAGVPQLLDVERDEENEEDENALVSEQTKFCERRR
jgi:hypothetical protein